MSPKPALGLEAVLQAARDLVREKGGDQLNARALAKRLGTSTMPIYSAVGSMDELVKLLKQRLGLELQAWQQRSWGPNAMLDMAVGYVMFAREESRLFHFLFSALSKQAADVAIGADPGQLMNQVNDAALIQASSAYQFIASMAQDSQKAFIFRTWVFVHGLAVLLADGVLALDQAAIIAHIEAAGAAFYIFHSQTA